MRVKALLKFGEDAFTKFSFLYTEPLSQSFATEALLWFDLISQIRYMIVRYSEQSDVVSESLALSTKAFITRCDRLLKLNLFSPEHTFNNAYKKVMSDFLNV